MPELPEIETLRRSLKPVLGKYLAKINFSKLAPIETTTANHIQKNIQNQKIQKLARHGKYLLIVFSNHHALVIHLGMSGQLIYYPSKPVPERKHQHMILIFSDGSCLSYVDPRRFGTISLLLQEKPNSNPFLQRLGPDYLDKKLTDQSFIKRCRTHSQLHLKGLLLNQGVAAGMGNIYACEALYDARLDPRRRVSQCSDDELKSLFLAAKKVLTLGIKKGGTSFRDYVNGRGAKGVMKNFLQVYDRANQMSLDQRGKVKKIVQNARSTYYVSEVQK